MPALQNPIFEDEEAELDAVAEEHEEAHEDDPATDSEHLHQLDDIDVTDVELLPPRTSATTSPAGDWKVYTPSQRRLDEAARGPVAPAAPSPTRSSASLSLSPAPVGVSAFPAAPAAVPLIPSVVVLGSAAPQPAAEPSTGTTSAVAGAVSGTVAKEPGA